MPDGVAEAAPGWAALLHGGNRGRALTLSAGVALHAIYVFVVATVLPSAVAEIGGLALYAWATTVFVVASIVGAAGAADLAARSGLRKAYGLAAGLFLAGSVVAAIAPTMPALLVGRGLQGFGGGLLTALAYATIRQVFPEPLRPRALAMVSGVWGIAALSGPLLGGAFATLGIWRGAFWAAVPLTVGFIAATWRTLPTSVETRAAVPVPAVRLALLALAALAVSAGSVDGRLPSAIAGLAAAAVLIGALFALDRRAPARLLPTGAFDPRTAVGAVSATMALLAICGSTMPFLTYILASVHDWSPLAAGYVAALQAIGWTSAALVTAAATPRQADRLIRLGPPTMAAGQVGVALSLAAGLLLPTALAWTVVGIGIGMCWAHLGNRLMTFAAPGERDVTAAFVATTQLIALAFGSALAGMVANVAGLAAATGPAEVTFAVSSLFATFAAAPLAGFFVARRIPPM